MTNPAARTAGTEGTQEDASALLRRVSELQASIAADIYTPSLFVPWQDLEQSLDRYKKAVGSLQALVDTRALDVGSLANWLRTSQALPIVRALFVAPQVVGFADGRSLPELPPSTEREYRRLAQLLTDLGIERLLPPGARVADVVRAGLIGLDTRRRGFRRRDALQSQMSRLIQRSIQAAGERLGLQLKRVSMNRLPAAARPRGGFVIGVDDAPVATIIDVFESASGGRQQRDLTYTYPNLQRELDAVPISLILILDGRGIREAPRNVLSRLLSGVASCMSRQEAAEGRLTDSIVAAVENGGRRPGRREPLAALIAGALSTRLELHAAELPGTSSGVILALGEYVSENPHLDLELDPIKGQLAWRNSELVGMVHELRQRFDPWHAAQIVLRVLSARDLNELPESDPITGAFGTVNDRILPERILVGALKLGDSEPPTDILRVVGRLNRQRDSGGNIAFLCIPGRSDDRSTLSETRALGSTSIVTLDVALLEQIVTNRRPRDVLVGQVLSQADLTKANPFTVMGATGRRMFYGRSAESSVLLNTVRTNSAAILGGRRIGKTSLLQNSRETLTDEGFHVWYADCQAVGSWAAFAQHIGRHWDISVSERFSINEVGRVFDTLQGRSGVPLVVMLDEVDNLLRWDRSATHSDGMREPLFRAFRALSQEGRAQFVFSGERLIASVLWDPTSPHWNFCRPIHLRQLDRHDADSLLTQPLAALGVRIADAEDFLDAAWDGTSGHPQIVQQLGESLVNGLNDRPAEERSVLARTDVEMVLSEPQFQRHYVTTYWGQSNTFERLLSVLIAQGHRSVDGLATRLRELRIVSELEGIRAALRMLDLYGIIDAEKDRAEWRANAFSKYLDSLGGTDLVRDDLVQALKGAAL